MNRTLLLEELSLNAHPAYQTIHYDGWVLRLTDGFTRRANSVQPLYKSTLPVEEKLNYCEAQYGVRGLRTVFKLTGAHHPVDLDHTLEKRGYEFDAETRVQTLALDSAPSPEGSAWAVLDTYMTPIWLEEFARLRPLLDEERDAFTRLQLQIAPRCGYVRLIVAGITAGVAMGVIERGWLGIYDVIVEPALRGQGYGRQIMLHLMAWGAAQGASHAYLQVMANNAPALQLYKGLGFKNVYSYWYRQKYAF
ncbi:MAG: putative acetyltransferase [Chloroflexi bacterium OLB15]|nr:MAG: putative acetyltransferase [Chloroflexi bacterium OLB15]